MPEETKTDFSCLSPFYDFLGTVTFAGKLHTSQKSLVKHYPSHIGSILILGGGTGKFLLEILQSITFDKLVYIDISEGMINSAQKKISKYFPDQSHKVDFICGDEKAVPERQFDLIVTHYFLDCFSQKDFHKISSLLHKRLSPEGHWSMADFYNKDDSKSRTLFISLLYVFFSTVCKLHVKKLPDFDRWFDENLNCIHSESFAKGMLKASLYKKP